MEPKDLKTKTKTSGVIPFMANQIKNLSIKPKNLKKTKIPQNNHHNLQKPKK